MQHDQILHGGRQIYTSTTCCISSHSIQFPPQPADSLYQVWQSSTISVLQTLGGETLFISI